MHKAGALEPRTLQAPAKPAARIGASAPGPPSANRCLLNHGRSDRSRRKGRRHQWVPIAGDIQTAKGMTTTIVNDIGGAFIATDGGVRTLSSSSAVSIRPPIFPFLLDALNLNDTRTHVSDSGPLLPSGLRQQVRARLDLGPDVMSQLRGRASDTVLWLGADNRPMRIDFVRVAADNHYVTVPFSLLVSDYRVVNGIAIAFRQEEQLQGRTVKVMTFQTVQLGPSAAVSDSDFRVPSAAPGGAQ